MPRSSVGAADVLSSALRAMQLHGQVFCRSEFSAPWNIEFPAGPAYFHVVERGTCWVAAPSSGPPLEALAGDLVVLARGEGHRIASAHGGRAVPLGEVLRRNGSGSGGLRWGGGGAESYLTCGTFHMEEVARGALVPLLPPVLHVPGRGGRALEWLDVSVRALAAELNTPSEGSELAVSRLVDLMFIQVLRFWLHQQPRGVGGWLGATRDPHIGAALARMHAEPARAWGIEALARAVGMSRSAFGARFAALVGEPPLRYLTRWRMQIAATLLRGSALRTHEIATRVGYATEAAFSRTFNRLTGEAPRDFRRRAVARGAESMPPAPELRPHTPAPRRDERRAASLHS